MDAFAYSNAGEYMPTNKHIIGPHMRKEDLPEKIDVDTGYALLCDCPLKLYLRDENVTLFDEGRKSEAEFMAVQAAAKLHALDARVFEQDHDIGVLVLDAASADQGFKWSQITAVYRGPAMEVLEFCYGPLRTRPSWNQIVGEMKKLRDDPFSGIR